jgi:hypothetical protein
MNRLRILAAAAVAGFILAGDLIGAGGLPAYREFSIGSTVTEVLALGRLRESSVTNIHERPAAIREVQWRPSYAQLGQAIDPVRDIRFRFYNDRLYQIFVTYERARTEGLTDGDLVESLSEVYGTPLLRDTRNVLDTRSVESPVDTTILAQWEDVASLLTLSRGTHTAQFQLELISKTLHAQARSAMTEAVRLDVMEAPQRDQARRAKDGAAATLILETARTTNKAAFRP